MEYQQLFSNLGNLLLEFPKLCNGSKFLFVPGPNDPGAKCLPRAAIPSFFTQGFTSKFENASNMISFTTNPCRIKYFTQEIVVFRDNVLNRMRRQCVVPPIVKSVNNDGGEMGNDEEEDMDDGEEGDVEEETGTMNSSAMMGSDLDGDITDEDLEDGRDLEQTVYWGDKGIDSARHPGKFRFFFQK